MLQISDGKVTCCGKLLRDLDDGCVACAVCGTVYERAEVRAVIQRAIDGLRELLGVWQ